MPATEATSPIVARRTPYFSTARPVASRIPDRVRPMALPALALVPVTRTGAADARAVSVSSTSKAAAAGPGPDSAVTKSGGVGDRRREGRRGLQISVHGADRDHRSVAVR